HSTSYVSLHQPVFQGMIGDQAQPATLFQQSVSLEEEFLQGFDLLVYLNPEGLEDLGQDLMFLTYRKERLQYLLQFLTAFYLPFLPGSDNGFGDLGSIPQFPIVEQHFPKRILLIIVHYLMGAEGTLLMHPHVQL